MNVMKMFRIPILCCALLASSLASGQLTPPQTEPPFIELTGVAEQYVVPDEIYISITLRERPDEKNDLPLEAQERRLKENLQSIGIDLKDLAVRDIHSNYIQIKWRKKDVVAESCYLLKVDNAELVGKVFRQLDELKIDDANIARVWHSRYDELLKEMRIAAIRSAKEKADYLLEAIGEYQVKPIKIQDVSAAHLNRSHSQANVMMEYNFKQKTVAEKEAPQINFEKIRIASSIYVKFEII